MEAYNSKVSLPGAIHNVIYRFHSSIDTTASWQAIFYEGDNYEAAAKAYKNLYKLIKNSSVKWVDNSQIGFSGQLMPPRESLRFTLSTLTLDVVDRLYRTFVIEIEMINSFESWEVHMNLQNKRNDTDQ
ncbi:MAG: hypothetical protein HY305_07310 [Sphingobacteriales bacterium]|nr:hypothetical protein [Sphingobacteriales bacterium]